MTTTRKQPAPLVKSEHAKTWHIDDGTAPDGSERKKSPVRRVFTPEYKLAILAEYDGCSETGERGPCCGGRASTPASSPTGVASTAKAC